LRGSKARSGISLKTYLIRSVLCVRVVVITVPVPVSISGITGAPFISVAVVVAVVPGVLFDYFFCRAAFPVDFAVSSIAVAHT